MALRAREIYYFVRVGNYASRPLRALSADMARLGRAGDEAATRLERLQIQQRRMQREMLGRTATIQTMIAGTDPGSLSIASRQLALQRAQQKLAANRSRMNLNIVNTERQINAAIAKGNVLEQQRVVLQEAQQKAALTARTNIEAQRTLGTALNAEVLRQQKLLPLLTKEAQLRRLAARFRLREFTHGENALTVAQQQAALSGRQSRIPAVASRQRQFLVATAGLSAATRATEEAALMSKGLTSAQDAAAASAAKLGRMEADLAAMVDKQAIAMNRAGGAITANQINIDKLKTTVAGYVAELNDLAMVERKLTNDQRALIAATNAHIAELERLGVAQGSAATEAKALTFAIEEQQRAIRQHKWDRIALGSRAFSDLGRTAQYAGAIVIGALGFMAKKAADFNTQTTLAVTQVTNKFRQIGPITKQAMNGILDQMGKFPASSQDMTKSLYDIYSSLVLQGDAAHRAAKGLQILTVFNNAAMGGQANLVDVTRAGVTILNQFAKTGRHGAVDISRLGHFINIMFAAVKFGTQNMQEFTGTLAAAAPAARAAHQSFSDMAATVAYLTKVLPVRQAAVGYARLLDVFQRMGPGLKKFNIDIKNQGGFMRPLQSIIGDIVKRFPKLAEGRQFLIPWLKEMTKGTGQGTMATAQARRALVFLIQRYKEYQDVLRRTKTDQGEFARSVKALGETPGVKFRVFINQLHAMAVVIGQDATPALLKLIKPIEAAIHWFNSLGDAQKRNIANIAVWTGGILLLGGTLATIIGTLGRMVATLSKFTKVVATSRIAMGTLAAETGAISAPLAVLLGAATALLILYIKYPKEFHKVTKAFFDLGVSMDQLKSNINSFMPIGNKVIRWAQDTYDALNRLKVIGTIKITVDVAMHLPGVGGPLRGIADTIRSPFKAAFRELAATFTPELPLFRNLANVSGLIAGHFHHASKEAYIFGDALRRIARAARNVIDAMNAQAASAVRYGNTIKNVRQHMNELLQAQAVQRQNAGANVNAQKMHNAEIRRYIRLAIQANRIARLRPHDYQAQLHAAQILAQINKKFKGAELDAIMAIISADDNMTKKRMSNAKKAAKVIADTLREAVDNMRSIYDNFVQQNQQILGTITEGIRTQNALEFGAMPSPGDLLADLRQQVHRFEAFRHELDQLAARGFPFALIQQLEQAGISAEPIARGLLHMNRRQMGQYIALFKRGAADVQKAAKIDFNFQLADWRKHGRRAAILFMRGIADEKSFISKEMRRIFLAWLRGNTAASLGRRPPRVPPHRPPPRHPPHHPPHRPPHHRQRHLQSVSTTHHTEIHNDNKVVVHQGQEDLSTTIRKARRHQRINASRIRPI